LSPRLPLKENEQTKVSLDEDPAAEDMNGEDMSIENTRVEDTRIEDLGTYGETFPIQEKSLLEVIKTKLKSLAESGKLAGHQKTILKKAKEQLNRPTPVKGLAKTTTPRSFPYDPSIMVPYDLKDHEGRVFQEKGTMVNPLGDALSKMSLIVCGWR